MKIFNKISNQDKEDLFKSLALLFKNGTPVNQAFGVLANQAKAGGALKKSLERVRTRIEKGSTISEVLATDSNFDPISVSFIKAGEESGTLSDNLFYLANWLSRSNKLSKEISAATLYPKIIIAAATLIGSGLAFFVLPRLVPVFGTLNVELPIMTRMLLALSDFIASYGLIVAVIAPFVIFSLYMFSKWMPAKKVIHKVILRLPIAGNISRDYQLAIVSQLVSILLKSGMTITDTFEIAGQSVTNLEYARVLEEIKDRITKGTNLTEAINQYPGFFPGVFSSMVAAGEESGSYTESFGYLSEFFSDRVKDKTERLPVVIEPLLLIFIGLMVAFLASAIILPIYEITQGLQ